MNLLPSRASTRNEFFQKFINGLEDGRKHLVAGIGLDEKTPDYDRNGKIQVCEFYKKGIDSFKSALSVNIMDIPEDKRAEVREKREKVQGNLKAAEERFIDLTNKLLGVSQPSSGVHPSSSVSAVPYSLRTTGVSTARSRSAEVRGKADKHLSARAYVPSTTNTTSTAHKTQEFAFLRKSARNSKRGENGKQTTPSSVPAPLRRVTNGTPVTIGCIHKKEERVKGNVPSHSSPSTRDCGCEKRVYSGGSSNSMKRILGESNKINVSASLMLRVPTRTALLKGVDAKLANPLLDEMLDQTGVTLKDVYGCDSAKQALEEAVILPALNPGLFSGLRQPVKGILLFGPPGNGKTLLAKAVATESGQVFFNLSAASLTSKWVGDAEKTVRCLFQLARNAQPCVIFIDEIDSILCERSEKESDSSRRMKTEFLIQFDGATSSANDRILVIGATNRPQELDDAVLRRFPKRVMLGLPDEKARFAIIQNTLKKHNAMGNIRDSDIRYISSRTDGYSNSDLVALCKEAAMVPVRDMDRKKLATVDETRLRHITSRDFDEALRVIRPSTSDKHLEKMKEFAARAGQM